MPQDQLLDHQYDGIQEYDNPCPGWWHAIFWTTVLFSVVYFLFFHVGNNGWTPADTWNSAQAEEMRTRFADMGKLENNVATILKYKDDTKWMNYANSVFLTNCQSCHGPDGAGVIGPNLTDDYYRNITKITDIATVIENGAAGGQMPSWRGKLQPNEIILMASYAAGLRGKNLQGKPVEPDKDKRIPEWSAGAENKSPSPAAKGSG
jgi:cytochrome c oxidase cbb3-type subunit III